MDAWVGIDGGGTRATAVAVDAAGQVISRVAGGAALVDPMQPLRGAIALADLARRALDEAGVKGRAVGLCCALAGAGRASVRGVLTSELTRASVATKVIVIGDAEAALSDAFDSGAGALLISGTGSAAWSRDETGRQARAGGWGMVLGDEGSGYAVGLSALRLVVHAADGRAAATCLTERVLAATGVAAVEDLVAWTAGADKAAVASLAPTVFSAASENDAGAVAIALGAATDLAHQVHAVLDRTGPWTGAVDVAFAGGLIAPGQPLRERAWLALQALPYGFRLRAEAIDAARGAACIARASS